MLFGYLSAPTTFWMSFEWFWMSYSCLWMHFYSSMNRTAFAKALGSLFSNFASPMRASMVKSIL